MSDTPFKAEGIDCRRWDVPQLDDTGVGQHGHGVEPRQSAWEAGFEQGRQEGLAAARSQLLAQGTVLQQLMQALATPLNELDEEVEKELVDLAMTVARQVVFRELRTDPALVAVAVRKAISVLPAGTRDVRLHLHPDDASLVRELLPAGQEEGGWQIVEDVVHDRGGCRVSTQTSQVDATPETRLARVIAAVLGESGESS